MKEAPLRTEQKTRNGASDELGVAAVCRVEPCVGGPSAGPDRFCPLVPHQRLGSRKLVDGDVARLSLKPYGLYLAPDGEPELVGPEPGDRQHPGSPSSL